MARVKIKFPDDKCLIELSIPVRITDINYGGHLGNDALLSIIHEARVQLLQSWGFTELNAGGNSLIMADVAIAYKKEAFYGDILNVKIWAEEIGEKSFDLLYLISCNRNGQTQDIGHVKTGLVCYDYELKKIANLKEALRMRLTAIDF
jgi:YbgC/YbaW family acyl-CoA thioester hydrolase